MLPSRYFPVPYDNFAKIKALQLGYSIESFYITMCQLANNLADDNGWFYRSISDLQKDCNMERKTIFTAIKVLSQEEYSFIYVDRTSRPNNYKISNFIFKSFKRDGVKFTPLKYQKTALRVV